MPYFGPKTAENTANGKAIAVSDAVFWARKIPAKFSTRSDFVEKNGPNKAKFPAKFSTCSDFVGISTEVIKMLFLFGEDPKSYHHFSHSLKKVARHRTTFL